MNDATGWLALDEDQAEDYTDESSGTWTPERPSLFGGDLLRSYVAGWEPPHDAAPMVRVVDISGITALVGASHAAYVVRKVSELSPTVDAESTRLAEHLLGKLLRLPAATLQRAVELDSATLGEVLSAGAQHDEPMDIDLYLGPWKSSAQVQELLNVDEARLAEMVEESALIGLRFSDGALYFPTRQFDEHGPIGGLVEVTSILAEALTSPQSIALWLSGTVELTEPEHVEVTMWDLLAQGRVAEVLQMARNDLAAWGK